MLENWIGELARLTHKYGISRKEFAECIGVTTDTLEEIFSGHLAVGGEVKEKIRNAIEKLLIPAILERSKCICTNRVTKEKNTNDRKESNNMATKEFGLTDEQVEQEIERLRQSPLVALARREQRLRYRRRQFLYQLRDLEKKGAALQKAGITREVLEAMAEVGDFDEPC